MKKEHSNIKNILLQYDYPLQFIQKHSELIKSVLKKHNFSTSKHFHQLVNI